MSMNITHDNENSTIDSFLEGSLVLYTPFWKGLVPATSIDL